MTGSAGADGARTVPPQGRMLFGDHLGWALLAAWLAPAVLLGVGDVAAGDPARLIAALVVGAPALLPAGFVLSYLLLWIVSRHTGWPGRASRPGHPEAAFWLFVTGLPCLATVPVALAHSADHPPLDPAALAGIGLSSLTLRGEFGQVLLISLPLSFAAATVVAILRCLSHLAALRAGRQAIRRSGRRLGTVAPALALCYLAVVAALILAQAVAPVEMSEFVPLALLLPPFASAALFPAVWPLLRLAARWRRHRGPARPGGGQAGYRSRCSA